jgi:hypothetical protein
MMKLYDYTFTWDPDRGTEPTNDKYSAMVKTYSSVAFFSWGLTIVGKEILLEWDTLDLPQYNRLREIFALDAQVVWEPCKGRITHGTVANGPFIEYKPITGVTSGALADIILVNSSDSYIDISGVNGTFQVAETVRDNSSPIKSAVISALSIPKYYVNISHLDGQYVELVGPSLPYRSNVKMSLVIMGIV